MIADNDTMTGAEFRAAYGVPFNSDAFARESLAMQREALREVYGDRVSDWRDEGVSMEDDEETEEGDCADLLREARGWSRQLSFELADQQGED